MGTALALLFHESAAHVRLWSRSSEHAQDLMHCRYNHRHLPGIHIPHEIEVTASAEEALDGAELIVAAIPSVFLRSVLGAVADLVPPAVPLLSVVKGIENGTFDRPSQIIGETLGDRSIAVLSGPSHAEEIARGLPASVVVAGTSPELNHSVQASLSREVFRVYTNSDVIGVELAGALKNILGLAAGICDGLGFGDNAKAALLTRGLAEITRMGLALGGRPATFYGLAGIGDLLTTCYSLCGRNRSVGVRIGHGEHLEQILEGMVNVAEGVPTTRSVHSLALNRGIDMPITAELHQVLFQGKSPHSAVSDLMVRIPRDEWDQ
jgi:glycerol-3-phosphate dehydrogenase (NAD(P)+)